MPTTNQELTLRPEFVPREACMAVLFPTEAKARTAATMLGSLGIDPTTAELVVRRPKSAGSPAGEDAPENELDEAGEEIANVAGESFSDDEKILAQIRRALGTGAVAMSFLVGDAEGQREEIAKQLKAQGALAVYFFGIWTTEWL